MREPERTPQPSPTCTKRPMAVEGPDAELVQCAGCRVPTHTAKPYRLVRLGVECKSRDAGLGTHRSLDSCAEACRSRDGCRYGGGVCGLADPTPDVRLGPEAPETAPPDTADIGTWVHWRPLPRVDIAGTVTPGLPSEATDPNQRDAIARAGFGFHFQDNHTTSLEFTVRPGGRCPSDVPLDEVPELVRVHSCHGKCSAERAPSSDCAGFLAGEDSPTSPALCVPAAMCRYLCTSVDHCVSADVHTDLPRCFLNSAPHCKADYNFPPFGSTGPLPFVPDFGFDVHYKVSRPVGSAHRPPEPAARDTGFSWPQLLRFAPLVFPRGGEYTLCFCDAAVAGGACRRLEDFRTRIGSVHVSGVSCLLADQNLARATCLPQYRGGQSSLRCYAGAAPPFDVPEEGPCVPPGLAAPAPAPTPAPTAVPTLGADRDTFCIFEPEELLGDHVSDRSHQCQTTASRTDPT